ncbi:MAG: hypothetical protein AB7E47_00510 [Desulfovibrionaceae bacterium]
MSKVTLQMIASISAGHPIRGSVRHVPDGVVTLIQLKNVDPVRGIGMGDATRFNPAGRKPPTFLEVGDILFVNRGMRFYGVLVSEPLDKAVAAPHFFVVKARSELVLPEYLAWYLNHKRAQAYFRTHAAGTALPHVSSKILGELPIDVPDRKTQITISHAHACVLKERQLAEELILKREALVTEILDRAIGADGI